MWEHLHKNIFACWHRCVSHCRHNHRILCFLMLYLYILFWCRRTIVYDRMDINKKNHFFFSRVAFVFYLIKKFMIKTKVVRYLEISLSYWKFEIMNWIINVGIWLVTRTRFWYILYRFLAERLLAGFEWSGLLI